MKDRRQHPIRRFVVGLVYWAVALTVGFAGLAYEQACGLHWRFTKWRRKLRHQ